MAYITFNDLNARTFSKAVSLNESLGAKTYERKIFLSYSHADKNYVSDIAKQIRQKGGSVYVDFLDESLVGKTNE